MEDKSGGNQFDETDDTKLHDLAYVIGGSSSRRSLHGPSLSAVYSGIYRTTLELYSPQPAF